MLRQGAYGLRVTRAAAGHNWRRTAGCGCPAAKMPPASPPAAATVTPTAVSTPNIESPSLAAAAASASFRSSLAVLFTADVAFEAFVEVSVLRDKVLLATAGELGRNLRRGSECIVHLFE